MKTKIISIVLFIIIPIFSYGAEVFLETENNTVGLNNTFTAKVYIDTRGDVINAVEGSVTFPAEILSVEQVLDGNSLFNFWIEKPKVQDNQINFSGMTPGGFRSDKVFLFSIVFKTIKNGNAFLKPTDIKAFLNDGNATRALASGKELLVSINADTDVSSALIVDENPPEDFLPLISKDPSIFDGKNFLVFSTQDKESGVDHYEVKEGFFGNYVIASSPFVLNDQSLNKKVYVKAVDKFRNVKVEVIGPDFVSKWFIYCIIILILISVFMLSRKKWKKTAQ